MASRSHISLTAMAERMIPPLKASYRKGQLGRIAVVGGSRDYTGAPFFSAITSARLGADMSHVICDRDAGPVIKTYSPNLMVHPYLRSTDGEKWDDEDEKVLANVVKQTLPLLDRLHVLVVGPGLGRDEMMHRAVVEILKKAREADMPVVLDADALLLVEKHPELVRGWSPKDGRMGGVVLTPNIVEFPRLARAAKIELPKWPPEDNDERIEKLSRYANDVAEALDVCIVLKGTLDIISAGKDDCYHVKRRGSLKRSGGQGDILTGAIGTFLCYRKAFFDRLWDGDKGVADQMGPENTLQLAAWMGCHVTREASRLAFEKRGRSMQAEDVSERVLEAFANQFKFDDPTKGEAKM